MKRPKRFHPRRLRPAGTIEGTPTDSPAVGLGAADGLIAQAPYSFE